MLLRLRRRQREAFADRRFDRGAGRRDQISKLIGRADGERADGSGRELHQVDRDHAPGALYAELLEEGGGHHVGRSDEGVRVQKCTADDADDDDGEAAAEDLTGPAAESAARQGSKVGDNLRDRNFVGREAKLTLEQCRIQILRSM